MTKQTKQKNIESIVEEFKVKTEQYDMDGGFIVYVDGYDNKDFDVDSMIEWVRQALLAHEKQIKSEMIEELETLKELVYQHMISSAGEIGVTSEMNEYCLIRRRIQSIGKHFQDIINQLK